MPFQRSQASIDIEKAFSHGAEGDRIGHQKLSAICGLDCDGSKSAGYGKAQSIAKKVEKDHGLCWRWDAETKEWHCLRNEEKPTDVETRQSRICKQAKRNLLVCDSTDFQKLDEKERAKMIVNSVLSGVIAVAASRKTQKTLTGQIQNVFATTTEDLLKIAESRKRKKE